MRRKRERLGWVSEAPVSGGGGRGRVRRTKTFRRQLSLVPGEAMAAPRSLSRLPSHCGLRAGPGLSPRSPVRVQRIPSQVCRVWGLSRAGALFSPSQLTCHRQRGLGRVPSELDGFDVREPCPVGRGPCRLWKNLKVISSVSKVL